MMAKTPKSVMNVLNKLAKEIEEKTEIMDALEFIINADKLTAQLDSTNKAIEREVKANTDRLSRLRTSIKNAESQETKVGEEMVSTVKAEKEKAQREIKSIKDDVARKRQWRDGEFVGCDSEVKEKKLATKRMEREISGNIAGLQKKEADVKSAYEKTKKLANV